jgi:hypothetical protein
MKIYERYTAAIYLVNKAKHLHTNGFDRVNDAINELD